MSENHTSTDPRIALIGCHIPAGMTPFGYTEERFLLLGQDVSREEYFAWMRAEIARREREDARYEREWRRDGWKAFGALVAGTVVLISQSYFWYLVVQHLINH